MSKEKNKLAHETIVLFNLASWGTALGVLWTAHAIRMTIFHLYSLTGLLITEVPQYNEVMYAWLFSIVTSIFTSILFNLARRNQKKLNEL